MGEGQSVPRDDSDGIIFAGHDPAIFLNRGGKMNNAFLFDKGLLALMCWLVVGTAHAVANETVAPVLHFGDLSVYPGLVFELKHDSNIARESDKNKISSVVSVLSPSVMLQAEKDVYAYSFNYIADIGQYSKSSTDNYVDQSFLGKAEIGLSTRATLNIKPEYFIKHDDRGSTYAITSEPNKWISRGVSGSLAYGAEEARGKVLFEAGHTDQQYQNNRTLTRDYDKTLIDLGSTFYLRVQPKTWVLAQAKQKNISYKSATFSSLFQPALSSSEQRVMVGLKWEATAQSSGEIKIGQLQKKFDSATYSTSRSVSWAGLVSWTPLSFVNVNLFSSKEANETTLQGSSAILLSNTGADVAYTLNDRVSLHASGYQLKEVFLGSSRADTTDNFSMKAEYKFRPWLVGSAEYSNSAKTSNTAGNAYKRDILTLGVHSLL